MSVHHEKMDGVRTHGEHAEAHLDTTTCRRSAQTLRRRSRFWLWPRRPVSPAVDDWGSCSFA